MHAVLRNNVESLKQVVLNYYQVVVLKLSWMNSKYKMHVFQC